MTGNETNPTPIEHAEAQLCAAMLAGDVAALAPLIHDALLFVGPDGLVYDKAADLDAHRRGLLRLQRLDPAPARIRRHGDCAVVLVEVALAGEAGGAAFAGRFRYLRTWLHEDGRWQVVAGQASVLPD